MVKPSDPFAIKEWGGDIADRDVSGWSWRVFEGTSLGEPGVGSLKRVISQQAVWLLMLILGLGIFLLIGRVWWLQGVQGGYWRGVAEGNRIRIEIINAPRGLIMDRANKVIAHNVASFRLLAVPAELPKDEVEQEEYLTKVLTDVPTELLLQDNITKLSNFSYLPLVIASPLSHDLALQLMTLVGQGSGLRVEPTSERAYDGGAAVAHVLGYVAPISAEEYTAAAGAYQLTDTKGKVGVEYVYEDILRGQAGRRQVEVDASGLERKIFATKSPVAGARLTLTVESEFQQVVYDALARAVDASGQRGGSVVVLRPADGEILALASYPSFDPNVFTVARNSETIASLLQNERYPLFNRPIGGEYPSGSTIKPLVAAAALAEGVITPTTIFLSSGGIYAGSQFFADWKAGGHGLTNVYKAIAESVNTFFYLIGGGSSEQPGLGITRLANYLNRFGLGSLPGIDLPGERSGFVPTPSWKQEVFHDHWYRGDTYNVAIGQGDLEVTPLQLAVAYAALATNGKLVKPHLVKTITYPSGEVRSAMPLPEGNVNLSAETLAVLQQAMRQTVTSGSARLLATLPLAVSGKTGTAQTGTKTAPHAWFVGYTPSQNPDIVVAVMIEYGGEGSVVATPVAQTIFGWYAQHQPIE